MDGIGAGIGDAVGGALAGFFDDPVTSLVVQLIGAYIVLVWLAVVLWAFMGHSAADEQPGRGLRGSGVDHPRVTGSAPGAARSWRPGVRSGSRCGPDPRPG